MHYLVFEINLQIHFVSLTILVSIHLLIHLSLTASAPKLHWRRCEHRRIGVTNIGASALGAADVPATRAAVSGDQRAVTWPLTRA